MHADQILAALRDPAIVMTGPQIREAWGLLKVRSGQVQQMEALQFRQGDPVEFDARGAVQRGVVGKINAKTISVKVGLQTWKVSPSLLRRTS